MGKSHFPRKKCGTKSFPTEKVCGKGSVPTADTVHTQKQSDGNAGLTHGPDRGHVPWQGESRVALATSDESLALARPQEGARGQAHSRHDDPGPSIEAALGSGMRE